MSEVTIRRMEEKDIPGILRIEEICFSRPWSEKSIRESFSSGLYYFYVAASGDEPIGYAGAYLTGDELNIANIAVFPLWRKRGIASALLEELIRLAAGRHLYGITLEVRQSNEAALALYRKYGFEQSGRRKNYYDNPTEDALILWRVFEE